MPKKKWGEKWAIGLVAGHKLVSLDEGGWDGSKWADSSYALITASKDRGPEELLSDMEEDNGVSALKVKSQGLLVVRQHESQPPSIRKGYEGLNVTQADVEHALREMDPFEADLLVEYFQLRRTQHEIARAHGMTQAGVSYRIDRALERIKWHLTWRVKFTSHDFLVAVESVAIPTFASKRDWYRDLHADWMALWWDTGNASVVAARFKTHPHNVTFTVTKWIARVFATYVAVYGPEPWQTFWDGFRALHDAKRILGIGARMGRPRGPREPKKEV